MGALVKRVLLVLMLLVPVERMQSQTSPANIFAANRDAIVQIFVDGSFSGCGFIISEDGFIATANHVVATEKSNFKEFASNIEVRIPKRGSHAARTIAPITDKSRNYDSAILKVEVGHLPFVKMGSLDEVKEADSLSLIVTWPQVGEMLLSGSVSGKAFMKTQFGPLAVNAILFQA